MRERDGERERLGDGEREGMRVIGRWRDRETLNFKPLIYIGLLSRAPIIHQQFFHKMNAADLEKLLEDEFKHLILMSLFEESQFNRE